MDKAELNEAVQLATDRQPVPVLWLIGKTQSGKTSLIRALTGSAKAEIGNGFQPCTSTSRFYDFPAELPLVRFLDTRGLGEVEYDPAEDIKYCESESHLIIAVIRASDPNQKSVFDVLRETRNRHPDWPVVIAQTALHQSQSPEWEHPEPYPYGDLANLPLDDLTRALRAQRDSLGKLAGEAGVWWVPVDFTLQEDGFENSDYGLDELWRAIEAATTFNLSRWLEVDSNVLSAFERTAHPHIVSYSMAAAGFGALPLVDIAGVAAIQLKLLHTLASIYQQPWSNRNTAEFFGFFGTGAVVSYGFQFAGRSVVKLIPVWGQTVGAVWGAASSGAITYGLGKAGCYYLGRKEKGLEVDGEALRDVFAQGLAKGRRFLERNPDHHDSAKQE